jgi:hypothetical protein
MIRHGDCLEVMRGMGENSIDAIVTDPPYGLEFMGKEWDHGIPGVHFWVEALRVAKPGCHLLAFGGTRTFHRLTCAIEDAGWEIRDCLGWLYGSGFPKSLDVSKAIDKAAGAEREVVGVKPGHEGFTGDSVKPLMNTGGGGYARPWMEDPVKRDAYHMATAPATDSARQWGGWGTALKPAWEPIVMARKPLDGTVAANVLKWGTGAINVNGCRVETTDTYSYPNGPRGNTFTVGNGPDGSRTTPVASNEKGRWPANLLHDGSDEVLELFPNLGKSAGGRIGKKAISGINIVPAGRYEAGDPGFGDSGSAARFFYCAKASRKEREMGCEGMGATREGHAVEGFKDGTLHAVNVTRKDKGPSDRQPAANHHPTVKPLALMRYLCRLVTPPNGTILDPFMGSGTTLIAAKQEGFRAVGIDVSEEYCEIAERRIEATV